MKKIILAIIFVIGMLMGAGVVIGTPKHTGMRLTESMSQMTAASSDTLERQTKELQDEIDYYMERHNVQDEGYEMVVAFANGQRLETEITQPFSIWNIGSWKNHPRQGAGIALDDKGRSVVGTWEGDSLVSGIRLDTTGTYRGDFSGLTAAGHGAFTKTDGSYYEGHWDQDRQHGFGIALDRPHSNNPTLRVGQWKEGRFQGERMIYTSERIYGIDIAKYQHGKGRRSYPIRWDKLRITHVGKKGSQNINGTADYPVSFVYIKSTEGTSIRNRFYLNDYIQARKHGIRTGAYHFFSVRTSGAAQANFFIKHTLFREGDLPPVLDIEPSKGQIMQMGGPDAMFKHIRTWLTAVEQRTHVKPILYVNQMFVNNYLSQQPDLKRDYRIWIARYSEYKPDIRLTYWQLCPDGRVEGIHGDVDINVFNGYKSQFEDYLEKETIK